MDNLNFSTVAWTVAGLLLGALIMIAWHPIIGLLMLPIGYGIAKKKYKSVVAPLLLISVLVLAEGWIRGSAPGLFY